MSGASPTGLHQLIDGFRNRFDVPAVGGGVVGRGGGVKIEVTGQQRRRGSDPATVDDQWHIGSCAKAMTATLYARLVEGGAAEWGVPISEFFPDLADDLDSGWSVPTIDELLVCRSGMRADLSRAEMNRAWEDASSFTEQRSRAVVSALSRPPRRRGAFVYSNLSYVVAGAAIDRITGMPFEDALQTHLLEPLGITSAGFGPPPTIWGHGSKLQLGSFCLGRGAPASPRNVRSDNPAVYTPAGRLHLTLTDWAKFHQLFLNRGDSLLRPETIEHLLALPEGKGKGMTMGWASALYQNASYGMQGSNTFWVATAIIDAAYQGAAMVVANDGRTRLLSQSARLATQILAEA